MRKSIYLLAFALITLIACKNEPTKEELALKAQIETFENLKVEAMQVHDEVMPKMNQLMELKGEITTKFESGNLSDFNEVEISKSKEYLTVAHDDMMSWMRDYSEKFPYGDPTPDTQEGLDKKLPVLKDLVEKIKGLKERTLSAIQLAQIILD